MIRGYNIYDDDAVDVVKEVGKNCQTLTDIRSMACRRWSTLPMRAFYQPSTHTQDPSAQHNQPDTPQRTDSALHTESDIACAAANVVCSKTPKASAIK